MKIISWNVNGIRAVYRKDFLKWMRKINPDILCLQEIKAQKEQIPEELVKPKGYHAYFNFAERKGYSGVVIYTKKRPLKIEYKLGLKRFDQEGRILKLRYPDFTLINLYFPHGAHDKRNLAYKLKVYNYFINYLKKIQDKNIILTGDFNIAHEEIDLARPKDNKDNIMFTLKERRQIDRIIKLGFIDTFRKFNKKEGNYTWWPYRFNAKEKNLGWRLDYVFVSKTIISKVKKGFILNKVIFSDHCPIGIEI
ncbi:exodeoxyribonuclease III [bacterium]|nr:MAG: exodeoxyribonuclease III [bacterium]